MPATESLPPGSRLPPVLQTARWVVRPGAFMEECRDRYGPTFTIRMLPDGVMVFLTEPETIKQVFTGSSELLHAGEGNGILRPVLGEHSVLLLDEKPHLRQRKLMLPAFHGERMQAYQTLIDEVTERELAGWPTGTPVAVWPRMQAITLEVIMRAVFGVEDAGRLGVLRDRLERLLGMLANRAQMALLVLTLGRDRALPWQRFHRHMAAVDEVLFDEIRMRRADPDAATGSDVLAMLLQARDEQGRPMTDVELRDELLTLLVAGHETTATSLSWALERLAHHPEVAERLTDEIRAGEDAYLDAVIRETLRLRPVLPIVARALTAPLEVEGRLLPAGTRLCPCIYLTHRRADLYPDPLAFRPERFLERPPETYEWIPFGGGIRRCLGAAFATFEMKTVLSRLLADADLQPGGPGPERIRRRSITLTPERGAQVVRSTRMAVGAAG